jgi:hypothetical protein
VVVASGDPDDLAVLCDRVLVLAAGRVRAELTAPVTADEIVTATYAPRAAAPAPPTVQGLSSPPGPQTLAGGALHV